MSLGSLGDFGEAGRGVMGYRGKAGICYAMESGWEQGHHTYCIYYSKKQGSEGKEGMDNSDEG